jgi:hypothetical protein
MAYIFRNVILMHTQEGQIYCCNEQHIDELQTQNNLPLVTNEGYSELICHFDKLQM